MLIGIFALTPPLGPGSAWTMFPIAAPSRNSWIRTHAASAAGLKSTEHVTCTGFPYVVIEGAVAITKGVAVAFGIVTLDPGRF